MHSKPYKQIFIRSAEWFGKKTTEKETKKNLKKTLQIVNSSNMVANKSKTEEESKTKARGESENEETLRRCS